MLQPLPLSAIEITDPFWARLQRKIRDQVLSVQYDQCESTGRFENFRRAARRESGGFQGRYYNDSDVYKWIEAASSIREALGPEPMLERQLSDVVSWVCAAQMEDGYLNTYFQLGDIAKRWTNLGAMHEMYCAGHLIEAGVAHFEASGERLLLNCAIKFADHMLLEFGPNKPPVYCGHPELELALLRLAKCTGNSAYADFARRQLESRGTTDRFATELADPEVQELSPWMRRMLCGANREYSGSYVQDSLPIADSTEMHGHAVRAAYLYAAAAEAFPQEAHPIRQATENLWNNLVDQKMYITGGIGDEASHEGFTHNYHLPNRTAYSETCASCAVVFWAQRLAWTTGNAGYCDVLERQLYNGALVGMSLDGTAFSYSNPLEDFGQYERSKWFECACCPPNFARLYASLGRSVAAVSERQFCVLVPCAFSAKTILGGNEVSIKISGDYAVEGKVTLIVHCAKPTEFELLVRIPDWSQDATIDADDHMGEFDFEDGFARSKRVWNDGDSVSFDFSPQVLYRAGHPSNLDTAGRIAVCRGPFVFCAEAADNVAAPQTLELDLEGEPELGSITLEGVTLPTIEIPGARSRTEYESEEAYPVVSQFAYEPVTVKFLPFFAFNNRVRSAMQVWMRTL